MNRATEPKGRSPLVSVIVPVYNGARFLHQALASIEEQTYQNTEVVVIDDGSTDASAAIACSFPRVVYLFQENQGVAAARNAALSVVKGEFICFLDADDFYRADKVHRQLNHLLAHPEVDCNVTLLNNFVEEGYQVDAALEHYFTERELINLSSIFVRSSVFSKVGTFNTSYRTGSDYEWVTRAREQGVRIEILQEVLMDRRIHDTNISVVDQANDKAVRFRILRESLARRRHQQSSE